MVLSFSQFLLTENFKNYIGFGEASIEGRKKYIDQVWSILQKSYSTIGGIKGSGFESKQALIEKMPFWKLYVQNDKVIAAAFYKDKGGRKAVAIASDGSQKAKQIIAGIYKASLTTSYGEKSGSAIGFLMKNVDFGVLENFLILPKDVKSVSGDDVTPVRDPAKLNDKDRLTYDKFPQPRDYFYTREIGGESHLKVMVGTPGLRIR